MQIFKSKYGLRKNAISNTKTIQTPMKKLISNMNTSPFVVYDIQYDVQLSANIIKARRARNLTQEELAKKIKTVQPAIARAENGGSPASHKLLKKIARVLDAKLIPPNFELNRTTLVVKAPIGSVIDIYSKNVELSNSTLITMEITDSKPTNYSFSTN